MDNVIGIKLITGEDVICQSSGGGTETCELIDAVVVFPQQDPRTGEVKLSFATFPMHTDKRAKDAPPTEYIIKQSHIVYKYKPAADLVAAYEKIFGSGIIVPTEKKLILG